MTKEELREKLREHRKYNTFGRAIAIKAEAEILSAFAALQAEVKKIKNNNLILCMKFLAIEDWFEKHDGTIEIHNGAVTIFSDAMYDSYKENALKLQTDNAGLQADKVFLLACYEAMEIKLEKANQQIDAYKECAAALQADNERLNKFVRGKCHIAGCVRTPCPCEYYVEKTNE
jgi:hypothetical protein